MSVVETPQQVRAVEAEAVIVPLTPQQQTEVAAGGSLAHATAEATQARANTHGNTRKRFALNVVMNWIATAASMVVPFFLTPLVVKHLGPTQYGIWVLAVSTSSYLALLDLGLRSAIVRFVSKAQAQHRLNEAASVICAALWMRLLIAAGVAALAGALALVVPHFFQVPADLMNAARITVFMVALGVGVTLVSGVFGAVLAAIHRFDLLSLITTSQTLLRALGVLFILRSGRGLISLAYWEFLVIAAAGLAITLTARGLFSPARKVLRRPAMASLTPLWNYSLTTFVFMLAVQVVINTDSLVIGACLSVALVTYYTIGSSLAAYAGQVAGAVSSTFTPIASNLEATGDMRGLQRMLLRGTQAMLGLTLPIAAGLAFRGEAFITLWMGKQYGHVSETVLRILMISLFFSMADATAASIMMAIEKHKPVARWAVYEAVLNLALSLILVRTTGLYGVAWGTSISMALTHLLFWPRYVSKILGVKPGTYLWQGMGKTVVCTIPFACACAITDHYWHARNMPAFFVQILAILPIYAVCVAAMFRSETRAVLGRLPVSRVLSFGRRQTVHFGS